MRRGTRNEFWSVTVFSLFEEWRSTGTPVRDARYACLSGKNVAELRF
jgi:hypothetical protein